MRLEEVDGPEDQQAPEEPSERVRDAAHLENQVAALAAIRLMNTMNVSMARSLVNRCSHVKKKMTSVEDPSDTGRETDDVRGKFGG